MEDRARFNRKCGRGNVAGDFSACANLDPLVADYIADDDAADDAHTDIDFGFDPGGSIND